MPSRKRKSKAHGAEYLEEIRREDRRESARKCYWRNREQRLEKQKVYSRRKYERDRQKLLEERERLKDDPEHQEQLRRAKEARIERMRKAHETRSREWREIGWIVAKMNIMAGLSQDQIYKLLGGLVTKKKIQEWCKRGKKLRKLKRPR